MKHFINKLGVAGMLIAVLLGFFSASGTGNQNYVPKQKGYWNHDPIVIVCEHSPYTVDEIKEALVYWENLGYQFEGVWTDFPCLGGSIPGAITIQMADQNFKSKTKSGDNVLATAHTVTDLVTGIIRSSKIEVLVKKERVLEHEIGHALGWRHFKKDGHIMNEDLNKTGLDSLGLKKE